MILIRDSLQRQPTGVLSYNVYREGKLIEEVVDNNLIVIGSQFAHAQLLGGAFTGNNATTFGVGTNATAAAFGNTALTGAYTNSLAAPTYPASNQVSFAFGLSSTEANGMAISEFGLITGAGNLYARKVRSSPLNKLSDISLTGTLVYISSPLLIPCKVVSGVSLMHRCLILQTAQTGSTRT